jgi:hypothetical protein
MRVGSLAIKIGAKNIVYINKLTGAARGIRTPDPIITNDGLIFMTNTASGARCRLFILTP